MNQNELHSFDYRNIEYDIVLFCGSFPLLLCGPGQALLGSEWTQARPGWEETQTGTGEGLKLSSIAGEENFLEEIPEVNHISV